MEEAFSHSKKWESCWNSWSYFRHLLQPPPTFHWYFSSLRCLTVFLQLSHTFVRILYHSPTPLGQPSSTFVINYLSPYRVSFVSFIILGDFNYNAPHSSVFDHFSELLDLYNLSQYASLPTHIYRNILDLIISFVYMLLHQLTDLLSSATIS